MKDEQDMEKRARFAKIWWDSRAHSGKSQEYMALGLGVSKKTIQNWERGISAPDLYQGIAWFELLGQNPVPYYLNYLYPQMSENSRKEQLPEERAVRIYRQLFEDMPVLEKQQLLYLMSGNHDCSWHELLQILMALCAVSARTRLVIISSIKEMYEMEKTLTLLSGPERLRPDMQLIENAIREGRKAVKRGENRVLQSVKEADHVVYE